MGFCCLASAISWTSLGSIPTLTIWFLRSESKDRLSKRRTVAFVRSEVAAVADDAAAAGWLPTAVSVPVLKTGISLEMTP